MQLQDFTKSFHQKQQRLMLLILLNANNVKDHIIDKILTWALALQAQGQTHNQQVQENLHLCKNKIAQSPEVSEVVTLIAQMEKDLTWSLFWLKNFTHVKV